MDTNFPQRLDELMDGDFNPESAAVQSTANAVSPFNSVRRLNALLRAEISAAETYRMAMEKLDDPGNTQRFCIEALQRIQEDHRRAAQTIRGRIRQLGGEPVDSSGAWGAWARFAMSAAKVFGAAAVLRSLKEGEESGLTEFRDGMPSVDDTSESLLQNELVPTLERHIRSLDQMIDGSGTA